MTAIELAPHFPAELVNWAGNRSGGVRRLFDDDSGRPGAAVFQTNLLDRLQEWSDQLAEGSQGVPRTLLLVGGPGNGKTEAIESTVKWLDAALEQGGALIGELRKSFFPPEGQAVPRLVRVQTNRPGQSGHPMSLSIVQDASTVAGGEGRSAAQLLLAELEHMLAGHPEEAYLCCVNRGILDDALIEATDTGREREQSLLEAVTSAISLYADAPSCWPLAGYADVAVWPMDAESLLLPPLSGGKPPARCLLEIALNAQKWSEPGTCSAGVACPFCTSRERLSRERELSSLLQILRWFEVGSGKRWSFRDLFTLTSYLLVGHRVNPSEASLDPCEWAARLADLDEKARTGTRPTRESSTAIFQLVSAQYQHALFHHWDDEAANLLLRAIKELGLDDDNTAMGLHWFIKSRKAAYLPAMIGTSLEGVCELMDPALADPDTVIQVTSNTRLAFHELDVRFSRSIAEGVDAIKKLQVLSRLELDLLGRLAGLDTLLSTSGIRRSRPGSAAAIQRFIRDFSCRLTRRAIGARTATVLDARWLAQFQAVVEDAAGDDLFDVAQEVEQLLNNNQEFEISLTTTFGQPLPPEIRRATLVVQNRPVRPLEMDNLGRPRSPMTFLEVGDSRSSQPVALTYELFKAIKELEEGMSPASLPRTVLALLDTARARLAGPIVRDQMVLERARIKIGTSATTVVQRRFGFAARKAGSR